MHTDDMAHQSEANQILASIEPDVFVQAFTEWRRQIHDYIGGRGDYVEKSPGEK
jgi:hypothetical protein